MTVGDIKAMNLPDDTVLVLAAFHEFVTALSPRYVISAGGVSMVCLSLKTAESARQKWLEQGQTADVCSALLFHGPGDDDEWDDYLDESEE